MRTASAVFGTFFALFTLIGCSDDSQSSPDSGSGDTSIADSGPDQQLVDAAPVPGSITVTVLKADGVWEGDFTTAPAAGATVAVDLPEGNRVEQTVPADGKLTVDNINWSIGTLGLTAFLKGYRLLSAVGLIREDGDQTLYLTPIPGQDDTVTICGRHGMRPARIDDAAENDWIEATAISQGMGQPEGTSLWLGGNDRDSEGTWRWADGEAFYAGGAAKLYHHFNVGEPNNAQGNEDCLMMYIGGDDSGTWNDANCYGPRYVVCEAY